MGKYFLQGTPLAKYERLMMESPLSVKGKRNPPDDNKTAFRPMLKGPPRRPKDAHP